MVGVVAAAAAASAMATATATATSLPSATASAAPATMTPPSGGDCELLGPFALVVQAGLGGLALLSLVYKRWKERPQRPLKIWFFDVSKQVFGSALVHVANIFMSMLTSGRFSVQMEPVSVGVPTATGTAATAAAALARRWLTGRDGGDGGGGDDDYKPNPCSFYLLNLGIDTTIGIPILIGLLKLFTMLAARTPLGKPRESIQSGYYGNPPNAWWWLKQSLIYFAGLFGMKVVVLIMFLVFPWLSHVGDWALRWTEGNEQLQIFFVMMLFPLIMNALQYYIIDHFIKEKSPHVHHHERIPDEDPDAENDATAAAGGGGGAVSAGPYGDEEAADLLDSDDEGDGGDDRRFRSLRRRSEEEMGWKMAHRPRKNHVEGDGEYDPDLDGDAPTVVGSSNTSSHRRGSRTSLGPELYPKE